MDDEGVLEHVWSSSKTCRRGKTRSSTCGFIAAVAELVFFVFVLGFGFYFITSICKWLTIVSPIATWKAKFRPERKKKEIHQTKVLTNEKKKTLIMFTEQCGEASIFFVDALQHTTKEEQEHFGSHVLLEEVSITFFSHISYKYNGALIEAKRQKLTTIM